MLRKRGSVLSWRDPLYVGAIAVVVASSGCGSDESGETTPPTVSIPAITSPLDTTSAPATTTARQTTSTTKPGKAYDPNLPDSETNDVPPPPGSPQEAFEKACEANPEACG